MKPMITWPYLAGFFDGEGSLGTYNNNSRAGGNSTLTLCQSGERGREVLVAIKAFLGEHGIPSYLSDRKASDGPIMTRQALWYLRVVGRKNLLKLLPAIRPYVIVKKQIVEDTYRFWILNPPANGFYFRSLNAERKRTGWYGRRSGQKTA